MSVGQYNVGKFLSFLHLVNRKARLKELAQQLQPDELVGIFLPYIVRNVSVYQFLIEKSTIEKYRDGKTFSPTTFHNQVQELTQIIQQRHPPQHLPQSLQPKVDRARSLTQFIDDRHHDSGNIKTWISQQSDQTLLYTLNKKVFKESYDSFVLFSAGIVTNFSISQKQYQQVLNNNLGKQLEQLIGINPFVSKAELVKSLTTTKSQLKNIFNLQFTTSENSTVSACVDIKKSIEYLLGKPKMQDTLQTPHNSLLL